MAALTLEGIRVICADLRHTAHALMEDRSVALIVGSTGQLSFTGLAARALEEGLHPHPMQRLLIRACETHHSRTGGDCKAFLFLLSDVMQQVSLLAAELGEMHARRMLLVELSSFQPLIPDLCEGIRDAFGIISDPSNPEVFGEHLGDIIRSRSGALSGIVCEFLSKSVLDWNVSLEALDYFADHFDDVCSKATLPVDRSSVLNGFLLNSSQEIPCNTSCPKFVVVWDVSVKMDDVVWVSDAISMLKIWSRIEASLNVLRDRGISMILTPSAAPSRLCSLCSRMKISLVDHVSSEDLQNILFFTGIFPMNTLNDTVETKCIAHTNSIRSVVFGSSRFVHLDASTTRSFSPCHVILCAPSPCVWKELYSEFLDCLKVVRQWLHPSMIKGTKRIGCTGSLAEPSRSESLNFKTEPLVQGCSFPQGLWEFALKLALPNVSGPCPNLCRLLDRALMATACRCWGIPVCHFKGRPSYEDYVQRNGAKKFSSVSPATNKEMILLDLLQLLKQLLKIDAVVGSKNILNGSIS